MATATANRLSKGNRVWCRPYRVLRLIPAIERRPWISERGTVV